jgi:hypothetical protein
MSSKRWFELQSWHCPVWEAEAAARFRHAMMPLIRRWQVGTEL